MENWKRLIPGVAGASLALGSEACGGSNGGGTGPGTPSSVARSVCAYEQACNAAYFNYASIDACVTAMVADWNTDVAPDLQAVGGSACESAYLAYYNCYAGLLNAQTCIDPTDAQFEAACGSSYDAIVANCTDPGGHGAAITAIAQEYCSDYQACEPTYFANYYGTMANCVAEKRVDLAFDLGTASSACQTAALSYHQCVVDAYTAPACSDSAASQACGTEFTAADTACGGNIPLTGGTANKSRAPGERHRPRWLRSSR